MVVGKIALARKVLSPRILMRDRCEGLWLCYWVELKRCYNEDV